MKAFLLALLLCLALLVGTALWLSYGDCTGLPKRLHHRIVLGEKDFIDKDVRFMVRSQGAIGLANGRLGGFTTVRASDCVQVTIESEDEGSPTQAEDEMEKKIRAASRVVERGLKDDLPGHPEGERAVLLLGSDARSEIVVWFKGNSRLHVIESASLAHALMYEKLIQRGYRIDPHGYVLAMGQ